ncbi:type I-F CRISPR-associated protein Csy1, partial [Candidatus Parcubacteria bacterium]
SLYSHGNDKAGDILIGTHSLQGKIEPDVVGNAAALDIAKFLSLEVDGKPLWQRAIEGDGNLLAALPGDDQEKRACFDAFAAFVKPKGKPASHGLAKQLYWPVDNGDYHLIQPLFATSLIQRIWEILREDRFGEAARAAREARRKGEPHPHGYREWPYLVIQKHGSTKPQNISQLNTVRHGEVWLLPSAPPYWQSREIVLPLKVKNLFERFGRLRPVREQLDDLARFLMHVKDWNNIRIRQGRARKVERIIDELFQYAATIQQCPPGWSADPHCQIPEAQRFWLDPYRDDPEFQQRRTTTDWPRSIAESFSAWFNEQLRHRKLPVGDAEYRAWRREFEDSLETLVKEMGS